MSPLDRQALKHFVIRTAIVTVIFLVVGWFCLFEFANRVLAADYIGYDVDSIYNRFSYTLNQYNTMDLSTCYDYGDADGKVAYTFQGGGDTTDWFYNTGAACTSVLHIEFDACASDAKEITFPGWSSTTPSPFTFTENDCYAENGDAAALTYYFDSGNCASSQIAIQRGEGSTQPSCVSYGPSGNYDWKGVFTFTDPLVVEETPPTMLLPVDAGTIGSTGLIQFECYNPQTVQELVALGFAKDDFVWGLMVEWYDSVLEEWIIIYVNNAIQTNMTYITETPTTHWAFYSTPNLLPLIPGDDYRWSCRWTANGGYDSGWTDTRELYYDPDSAGSPPGDYLDPTAEIDDGGNWFTRSLRWAFLPSQEQMESLTWAAMAILEDQFPWGLYEYYDGVAAELADGTGEQMDVTIQGTVVDLDGAISTVATDAADKLEDAWGFFDVVIWLAVGFWIRQRVVDLMAPKQMTLNV